MASYASSLEGFKEIIRRDSKLPQNLGEESEY